MKTLKPEILEKIKTNTSLVADLVSVTGKSYPTIREWLNKNSPLLTMASCLDVICRSLKMKQNQILTSPTDRGL